MNNLQNRLLARCCCLLSIALHAQSTQYHPDSLKGKSPKEIDAEELAMEKDAPTYIALQEILRQLAEKGVNINRKIVLEEEEE